MPSVIFSNELFEELNKICEDKNYSEVSKILARNQPKEEKDIHYKTIDINKIEAQLIADVAIVQHTQAGLIYPYWSDEHPNYNESHEESFFDVQSFFQTVLLSLSEFQIKTLGSSN